MNPNGMRGCFEQQLYPVTKAEYASLHAWMRQKLVSATSQVALPCSGGYSVLSRIPTQGGLFDNLAHEILAGAGVEVTDASD